MNKKFDRIFKIKLYKIMNTNTLKNSDSFIHKLACCITITKFIVKDLIPVISEIINYLFTFL